MTAHYKKKN